MIELKIPRGKNNDVYVKIAALLSAPVYRNISLELKNQNKERIELI